MNYPRDYVACGGEPHDDMQPRDNAAEAAAHAQAERGAASLPNPDHFIALTAGQSALKGPLLVIGGSRSGGKSNFVQGLIRDAAAGNTQGLERYVVERLVEDMFLHGTSSLKPKGLLP